MISHVALFPDHSHRGTSTYAQGARPKETTFCPPSSSSCSSYTSIARESSRNHLTPSASSQYPSLGGGSSSRPPARFSHGSAHLHPPQERQRSYQPSPVLSPSFPSCTSRYAAAPPRADTALPPRPNPESGEADGTRSTRRLLSRLFSRGSSQDSSSGSSVRSSDDDGAAAGGRAVASDQGSTTSTRTSEAIFGSLRNGRTERPRLQESNPGGYRSGPSQAGLPSCLEAGAHSGNPRNGGTASSWLSSSLRGRCSPLLSRLRRHSRDENERSSGRWGNTDRSSLQDDDCDEEEKEKEAVGLGAFGNSSSSRLEDEVRPDATDEFSPGHRVGACGNVAFHRGVLSGIENQMEDQKETAVTSKDQEKLRKIKERCDV